MTIRGGAGPRDDKETGDRRPPMARRSNDADASGPAPAPDAPSSPPTGGAALSRPFRAPTAANRDTARLIRFE